MPQVDLAVIRRMQQNGQLSEDSFRLFDGFTGEWSVGKPETYASRAEVARAKKDGEEPKHDSYRVPITNGSRTISVPGFVLNRARLVGDDKFLSGKKVKDVENVAYYDEVEGNITASQNAGSRFKEVDDNGKLTGFNIPDTIVISGAVVNKVGTGNKAHPSIPLRNYIGYDEVLAHHRDVTKDASAYITRDDFESYLKLTGKNRPATFPKGINELTLRSGVKLDSPAYWNFRLVIKDGE